MKHKILITALVVLMFVSLLGVASSGLLDTGIASAQGGRGEAAEALNDADLRAPDLTLSLSPYNPPIVVPASGGTFQNEIAVKNNGLNSVRFDIWTSLTLPDGTMVSPAGGPFQANIPAGWSVNRDDLTQEILADSPPGTYSYNAHVGRYPDRILTTESFTFDKLATGGWYAQSSGTSDWFFDIHFADADNGWAVGQTNEIVHTSNGGDTWTAQSTPVFSNFWTVFGADAQNAWIGGSLGVLLHTTDGGANWIQQNTGASPASAWEGIFFLDANNGWVVGGKPSDFTGPYRTIIHTTDGGATWETQYFGSNQTPLNAVHFVDANNGWAVGDGGFILQTSNGGVTWNNQTTGGINYFEGVYFTDTSNGWTVGRDGEVASTTDGGNTWNTQTLGTNYDFTGVNFADGNNGWITGINQDTSQAVIFRTNNGGASWYNQDPGPETILFNVVFVDLNNGWAAGSDGTIIHTDTGGE